MPFLTKALQPNLPVSSPKKKKTLNKFSLFPIVSSNASLFSGKSLKISPVNYVLAYLQR